MSKEIYISSTPHETRLAIVENDALAEIYYERENEYTLAGSIYNGRVTRVLPGMQSSFVDIGLERDAFLYITDFLEEAADGADFEGRDAGEARSSKPRERSPKRDEGDGEARTEGEGSSNGDSQRRSRRDRGPRRDGQQNGPRTIDASAAPAQADAAPRDADEPGEGAPGADGGRRWRGRRGRRRGGRADAQGAPQGQAAGTEGQSFDAQDTLADKHLETQGDGPTQSHDEGQSQPSGRGRRESRDARGRQDSVRERFAPRGPRHSDGDEQTVDLQGAPEAFVLPGESLSKYRRGEAPEASASHALAQAAAVARPSTMVEEPALAWDGGSTLPGETLSRHSESRSRREGRDSQRGRNSQSRQQGNHETSRHSDVDPAEAVQPAVTSQHEPEPFELQQPAMEFAQHSEASAEPQQHEQAQQEAQVPTHTEELVAEVATSAVESLDALGAAEYEPAEDASASVRADVDPPAKLRWFQRKPKPAPEAPAAKPAFTATEQDSYVESASAAKEFTNIEPTGEMLSAPPAQGEHTYAPPTAPIEHQQAVQSVTFEQSETKATLDPYGFSPGHGQLEEEEMLDDEDGQSHTLHANGEEEAHETLEGAADLGAMLREMSIDQITRPEDPSEDEDDEEDFDDFDVDEEEMQRAEGDDADETGAHDADRAEEDGFSAGEISESEEGEFAEGAATAPQNGEAPAGSGAARRSRRGRGDRGGNDRPRSDRNDRGKRDGRPQGQRRDGRMSRHAAQTSDLPSISELLKPGQELLVQIAKEPMAKKGARITSHIALPGRFLVFMPTVSHVGVSRKIESEGERRRLKEILISERGEASGGFIVRTAASGASEDELRSDLRFLLNLWTDIKTRSEGSKSPALIYHDLNLVERILRDQVTDSFSAIWVDTESEYERVLRFLQRFQPSLIRRVKLYTKETPLFEQFGITEEINKALRSKVWLKSGGSIVINQTEALVAIDINTGKYVGKTARLEDTIVKTNLDAIPEIVRQIRLRDLGGIIIIDFIDMDERKNRHKVMAALEEELKSDRAPCKVLQFNDFGLVAITRKRVKQSLERTLSTTCGVCQGTGMTKSPVTVCNDIYIEMRKMQKHLDRGDVMLRVNPEVVKQLKSPGSKWLQEMEEMVGKTILVKSDPSIHPEQFDIH